VIFFGHIPDATIDVVEIDPGMTKIAREQFRLRDDERLKIIHSDARLYLNEIPNGAYDTIFMDAFGTLFSIPYQLTTVEAVRQMHRSLKSNGVCGSQYRRCLDR
jgi:spermidine synthase